MNNTNWTTNPDRVPISDPAAEVEQLRADTVVLADAIRRILEMQSFGVLWRDIIPTMHPMLRAAVERAEALPTKENSNGN
jgi:hypothetical protein